MQILSILLVLVFLPSSLASGSNSFPSTGSKIVCHSAIEESGGATYYGEINGAKIYEPCTWGDLNCAYSDNNFARKLDCRDKGITDGGIAAFYVNWTGLVHIFTFRCSHFSFLFAFFYRTLFPKENFDTCGCENIIF